MSDKALDWLKKHDPEAKAPGYGDRYAPVPRHTKEIPASALDQVDEDGNVEPFDDWYSYRERYEDDEDEIIHRGPHVSPEDQGKIAAHLRDVFRERLAAELTAAELDHLARYEAGEPQQAIAARLGVSQKTISKRQRLLLAKVDATHRLIYRTPYARGRGV